MASNNKRRRKEQIENPSAYLSEEGVAPPQTITQNVAAETKAEITETEILSDSHFTNNSQIIDSTPQDRDIEKSTNNVITLIVDQVYDASQVAVINLQRSKIIFEMKLTVADGVVWLKGAHFAAPEIRALFNEFTLKQNGTSIIEDKDIVTRSFIDSMGDNVDANIATTSFGSTAFRQVRGDFSVNQPTVESLRWHRSIVDGEWLRVELPLVELPIVSQYIQAITEWTGNMLMQFRLAPPQAFIRTNQVNRGLNAGLSYKCRNFQLLLDAYSVLYKGLKPAPVVAKYTTYDEGRFMVPNGTRVVDEVLTFTGDSIEQIIILIQPFDIKLRPSDTEAEPPYKFNNNVSHLITDFGCEPWALSKNDPTQDDVASVEKASRALFFLKNGDQSYPSNYKEWNTAQRVKDYTNAVVRGEWLPSVRAAELRGLFVFNKKNRPEERNELRPLKIAPGKFHIIYEGVRNLTTGEIEPTHFDQIWRVFTVKRQWAQSDASGNSVSVSRN